MQPCGHLAHDGKLVRTRMTRPLVVALVIELDDEAVGTGWTEQHLVFSLLAECVATGWKLRVKAQSELMQRWSDGSSGDKQERNGENFGGRLQSKTLKPAPAKKGIVRAKASAGRSEGLNRSESHSRAAGQAWLHRSVIGTPPGRPSPSWPVVAAGFGAHRLAWRPASLAWSAVHQGLPAAPGLLLGHRHPQSQAEGERMMRIRSNSEHGLAADRIWPALWPSFSLNAASVCIRTTATVRICDIPLSLGRLRKRRRGRYDHHALTPRSEEGRRRGRRWKKKKKGRKKGPCKQLLVGCSALASACTDRSAARASHSSETRSVSQARFQCRPQRSCTESCSVHCKLAPGMGAVRWWHGQAGHRLSGSAPASLAHSLSRCPAAPIFYRKPTQRFHPRPPPGPIPYAQNPSSSTGWTRRGWAWPPSQSRLHSLSPPSLASLPILASLPATSSCARSAAPQSTIPPPPHTHAVASKPTPCRSS